MEYLGRGCGENPLLFLKETGQGGSGMPSEQPSSLLGSPEAEAVTGSGPRAWATLRPISQFPVSAGTIYGYQAVAILEVKDTCHSPELSNSSTQRSDRVMLYKRDSTIWAPAILSLAARVPYLKEEELAPQHHADGPEMYCRLLGSCPLPCAMFS